MKTKCNSALLLLLTFALSHAGATTIQSENSLNNTIQLPAVETTSYEKVVTDKVHSSERVGNDYVFYASKQECLDLARAPYLGRTTLNNIPKNPTSPIKFKAQCNREINKIEIRNYYPPALNDFIK